MNPAIAAGLFTGVQVGAALFMSRLAVPETGAALLGALRYAFAAAVLLPFFLIKGGPYLPQAADRVKLFFLGLGQMALMITLMNIAVIYTSAARVALVFACLPVVTLLINRLSGGQRHPALEVIGGFVTVAGVAVLVGADVLSERTDRDSLIGMAAAAAGTCVVGTCSILYKPHVTRYGTMAVSVWAFAVSVPALMVLALFLPAPAPVSDWSLSAWALVLATGISSGIGYITWFAAIRGLNPAAVTGFLALSPVTATVLTLAHGDAQGNPVTLLVSAAIVLSGAGLIALGQRQKQVPALPPA